MSKIEWRLVPVEPTEEMILAGHHKIDYDRTHQNTFDPRNEAQRDEDGVGTTCGEDVTDCYRAMLAAAPVPPAQAPVATVVSRHGNDLRVGWLRPESCDVGTLLYAAPVAQPAAPVAGLTDAQKAAPELLAALGEMLSVMSHAAPDELAKRLGECYVKCAAIHKQATGSQP